MKKDFAPCDVECRYNPEIASAPEQPLVYFRKYFTNDIFQDFADFTNSFIEYIRDANEEGLPRKETMNMMAFQTDVANLLAERQQAPRKSGDVLAMRTPRW
ncbi:hypothetical protein HPB48_017503 [Haemaphysalis longicornis]|uniref:Uncharacterized protein n=1 Tax=Haemaphysalis longicornis TaxID=44386 RepID=A0A9J6G7U8_HAELO|nr:hypothetical protein HPB48_017503 [Haemaphysalis longicornis]